MLGQLPSPSAAAVRQPSRRRTRCVSSRSLHACAEGPDYSAVHRNIALELVRVTEAAALASATWLGKGDKEAADGAAVDAMRRVLGTIAMDGVVVIGEGEKDEAPMLFCGERIGNGTPPRVDIAVDPLDGTTACATGRSGAVSVIALAERGALYDPGPAFYMQKIAVGPAAAHAIDITASVGANLVAISDALGKPVSDVTVVMLDRPRHAALKEQVRDAGARIRMISDGDVAAAIACAMPGSGVDVLMGVGGSPEGVIAAAALRCLGGNIQALLWPRDEDDRAAIEASGRDPSAVLPMHCLCGGEEVFFAATGVSDGELLQGVRFSAGGATTHSLIMRNASGTVRDIKTRHRWAPAGESAAQIKKFDSCPFTTAQAKGVGHVVGNESRAAGHNARGSALQLEGLL